MLSNIIWILILAVSAAVSIGTLRLLRRIEEQKAGPIGLPYKVAGISVAAVLLIVLGIKHIANVPIILLHNGVFWIGTMCADGIMAVRAKRRATAADGMENQPATAVTGEAKEQHSETPSGEKHDAEPGTKNRRSSKRFHILAAAAAGCLVYLTAGLLCANMIVKTEYTLTTDKELPDGELCIVQLSDVHLGATVSEGDFKRLIKRVAAENPDIVVITGDLTDDGTSRKMMQRCCEILGGLKPRFGIYYVPGNHDSEDGQFSVEELHAELDKNCVLVLQDEYAIQLFGSAVIGRKDATVSRDSAEQLFKRYEEGRRIQAMYSSDSRSGGPRYTILLDHEPNDFEAEAKAGADLVLCGHAHGGFLLPLRWAWKIFPDLIFRVDLCEGKKRIDNTDFIVSSGVGTCLTDFKTGTKSEYVVIRVKNKGQ